MEARPFARRPLAGLAHALLSLGLVAAPAAARPQETAARSPLVAAIPSDVFIVSGQRHNPERAFLEQYWGEVWGAFEESGVAPEFFEMLASRMDEATRAEMERVIDRFAEALAAVDWKALGEGEFVFAERLEAPVVVSEGVSVAPPDMVWLARADRETVRRCFDGLTGILEAALDEVEAVAGIRLEVEETQTDHGRFVGLHLTQMAPDAGGLTLVLGLYDDVLMISFGQRIHDDVVALLERGDGVGSIADTQRFRRAFARLPEPEDGFEYYDAPNLAAQIGGMFSGMLSMLNSSPGDHIAGGQRDPRATELTRQAYEAYLQGDYQRALELDQEAHAVDPEDPVVLYNLACVHALLGKPDEALDWLERAVDGGFHDSQRILDESDFESIRGEARFQELVARSGQGSDSQTQAVLQLAQTLLERVLDAITVIDGSATVYHTEGYSIYGESVTLLAQKAQENPFYPVVTGVTPVEDFAKYLPVETTSFAVSGGFDLNALYQCILDSLAQAGPLGEQAIAYWERLQEQTGFDVRRDVIGWIQGESVQASFQVDGKDAWIWMMRVTDEDMARGKLALLLNFASQGLAELAKENPMLGMLSLRVSPSRAEDLTGFHSVRFAAIPQPMECGVVDGWMIVASSPGAVRLCRATAAGEHANVRDNEVLMAAAIVPDGPVRSIHFTDHTGTAREIADMLRGLAMTGGMAAGAIPDPEAKEILGELCGLLGRLAPVVEEIDFYRSGASATSLDGKAWRTRSVTHYVPPQ